MRQLILIYIVLLTFQSVAQQTVSAKDLEYTYIDDSQIDEPVHYKGKLFNGLSRLELYSPDSKYPVEYSPYKNGLKQGKVIRYNKDSTIIYWCDYDKGVKIGKEYFLDNVEEKRASYGYYHEGIIDSVYSYINKSLLYKIYYTYSNQNTIRKVDFYHCLNQAPVLMYEYTECCDAKNVTSTSYIMYYSKGIFKEYDPVTGVLKTKELWDFINGRPQKIWTKKFNKKGDVIEEINKGYFIKGELKNEQGVILPNQPYKIFILNKSSHPIDSIIQKTDANGKYRIRLSAHKFYRIDFYMPGKTTFRINPVLNFKTEPEKFNSAEYDVIMKDTTLKIKQDYYNEIYIHYSKYENPKIIEVDRYLQTHDIEFTTGVSSIKKMEKFIISLLKKGETIGFYQLLLYYNEYQDYISSLDLSADGKRELAPFIFNSNFNSKQLTFQWLQKIMNRVTDKIKSSKNVKISILKITNLNDTSHELMNQYYKLYHIISVEINCDDKLFNLDFHIVKVKTGWKIIEIGEV